MKRPLLASFISVLMPGAIMPQTNTVTNQDIIKMLRAKMEEGWIVSSIWRAPADFTTTSEAIEQLKAEGATDRLIRIMIDTVRRQNEHRAESIPLSKVRKIYVNEEDVVKVKGRLAFGIPYSSGYFEKDIKKSNCLELTDNPAEADAVLAKSVRHFDLSGSTDLSCTSNSVAVGCESGNVGIRTYCIGENCTTYSYDPGLEVKWKFFDPDTRQEIRGWSSSDSDVPKRKWLEIAVGCRQASKREQIEIQRRNQEQ